MSEFQSILCFDTALKGCRVGFYNSVTGDIYESVSHEERGQAEHLLPLITGLLKESGKDFQDLDALLVTLGPGSFAGVRIGLSVGKSLALALKIPLLGISSLQALVYQYATDSSSSDRIAVILETQRQDFYFQLFSSDGKALLEARSDIASNIAEALKGQSAVMIGNGVERFRRECSSNNVFFEDSDFPDWMQFIGPARLAMTLHEEGPDYFIFERVIEPMYLRSADVSKSKKIQRSIKK